MNNKTGYGLRIVLGGYLAYLGIRMLIQTVSEKPANMMFMGAMAVIFSVNKPKRHFIQKKDIRDLFSVLPVLDDKTEFS